MLRSIPLFLLFIFSSALAFAKEAPRQEPDVIVLVSPILVKALQPKAVVDAIENPETAGQPTALVLFKIERLLHGSLPKIRTGNPSKWEQAEEAFHDKKFLKILTSDFSNAEPLKDKEWISVAVADPAQTFQISSWENPGAQKFKIRLRPVPGRMGSYFLVESKSVPGKATPF